VRQCWALVPILASGMRTIGRALTRLPGSVKLLLGQTEEPDLKRSDFAPSRVRNGPFVLGVSLLPLRAGSGEAANSSSDRDSWDPEEKVSAGVPHSICKGSMGFARATSSIMGSASPQIDEPVRTAALDVPYADLAWHVVGMWR